jgi:IclR family pca regulon transcriptional regulator
MSIQAAGSVAKPRRTRRASVKPSLRIEPSSITPPPGDRDFMTSLARGLAVIRVMSGTHTGLTIADLSRMVGVPRAAVRRCLHTLSLLGYVRLDARSFFLKARP